MGPFIVFVFPLFKIPYLTFIYIGWTILVLIFYLWTWLGDPGYLGHKKTAVSYKHLIKLLKENNN